MPGRVPGRGTLAVWRRGLASLRLALPRGVTLGLGPLEAALRSLRPEVVLLHGLFSAAPRIVRVSHELGAVVVAVRHDATTRGAAHIWRAAMRPWMRRVGDDVDAIMRAARPCEHCAAPSSATSSAQLWADAFEGELALLARRAAGGSRVAAVHRGLAAVGSPQLSGCSARRRPRAPRSVRRSR